MGRWAMMLGDPAAGPPLREAAGQHVASLHVASCRVTSGHVMSRHAVSCRVVPCHVCPGARISKSLVVSSRIYHSIFPFQIPDLPDGPDGPDGQD
jgi:hypothetical protein